MLPVDSARMQITSFEDFFFLFLISQCTFFLALVFYINLLIQLFGLISGPHNGAQEW